MRNGSERFPLWEKNLFAMLLCAGSGALLMTGCVLLGAVLTERGILQREAFGAVGLVSVTLGGMLTGVMTDIQKKRKIFLHFGAATGIYILLLMLLGAVLFREDWLSGSIPGTILSACAGSILGALLKQLFQKQGSTGRKRKIKIKKAFKT